MFSRLYDFLDNFQLDMAIPCYVISDEVDTGGSALSYMHIMDRLNRQSILAFLESFFKLKSHSYECRDINVNYHKFRTIYWNSNNQNFVY